MPAFVPGMRDFGEAAFAAYPVTEHFSVSVSWWRVLGFQLFLQLAEGFEAGGFEGLDPAPRNFVQGHGVQVVEFLATAENGGHEVGLFEDAQVFGGGLSAHLQRRGDFGQCLTIVLPQPIKDLTAVGIG